MDLQYVSDMCDPASRLPRSMPVRHPHACMCAPLPPHACRCCGVLEVARIARAGFPTRYTHGQFAERYAILLPGEEQEALLRGGSDGAKKVRRVGSEDFFFFFGRWGGGAEHVGRGIACGGIALLIHRGPSLWLPRPPRPPGPPPPSIVCRSRPAASGQHIPAVGMQLVWRRLLRLLDWQLRKVRPNLISPVQACIQPRASRPLPHPLCAGLHPAAGQVPAQERALPGGRWGDMCGGGGICAYRWGGGLLPCHQQA